MSDLLLELFSEEIPARMQEGAQEQLERTLLQALKDERLEHGKVSCFVTPRRLGIHIAGLPENQPDRREERKGPKVGSPEQALQGFLKSTGLTLDQLEKHTKGKDEFYFAVIEQKGKATKDVLKLRIEALLKDFHWQKSMRWGARELRWVRPLQNILCIFGSEIIPVEFGHLKAGNYTFGHRFMAPEKIEITDAKQYEMLLENACVMADRNKRKERIRAEAEKLAASKNLALKHDPALLDEVAGLVEWPVLLLGSIDQKCMDLPQEVLVSEMRNHQKYFALTYKSDQAQSTEANEKIAPYFVITANLTASDGGNAIIHGNERVLRARLEDGRFFWDSDRKKPLEQWSDGLADMVFHAKLGTVAEKTARIMLLAGLLAQFVPGADREKAERAARLCKADLTTGMVGEFPELQGIMGEYYACAQGESAEVALAIREHYQPQGPNDAIPASTAGTIVSLADKLDTLCGMFAVDEKPTGSKDPFALRRAALGIIRMILENNLRLSLGDVLEQALKSFSNTRSDGAQTSAERSAAGSRPLESKSSSTSGNKLKPELLSFFADRLKVQLKEDGLRPDVIDAVFASGDDDLVRVTTRARAVQAFLESEDGGNLLAAYTRAANIVAIEEAKDKASYKGEADPALLREAEEKALHSALETALLGLESHVKAEAFEAAMAELAALRAPVDAFFDRIMVNDKDTALRINRLYLLNKLSQTMDRIADFSRIQQGKGEHRKAA